jgi:hypothetical protein
MTETFTQPLSIYDSAPHDAAESPRRVNESKGVYLGRSNLPFNYAGLWQIVALQNASVELIFPVADLFNSQGIDGVVSGGWGLSSRVNRVFGIWTSPLVVQAQKVEAARRISLAEAQRLAIAALLEAEERRRDEREREAAFWAALED